MGGGPEMVLGGGTVETWARLRGIVAWGEHRKCRVERIKRRVAYMEVSSKKGMSGGLDQKLRRELLNKETGTKGGSKRGAYGRRVCNDKKKQ